MVWWILEELFVWLLCDLVMVCVGWFFEWATLSCMVQFWYGSYRSHSWATCTWLKDMYDDVCMAQIDYNDKLDAVTGYWWMWQRKESFRDVEKWIPYFYEGVRRMTEGRKHTYTCFCIGRFHTYAFYSINRSRTCWNIGFCLQAWACTWGLDSSHLSWCWDLQVESCIESWCSFGVVSIFSCCW